MQETLDSNYKDLNEIVWVSSFEINYFDLTLIIILVNIQYIGNIIRRKLHS